MASKIPTRDLKIGMFVSDLDRPWVDTPFLLQGFLIEDNEQIATLKTHCEYVMVDRARSTGDEYEAPPVLTNTIPPRSRSPTTAAARPTQQSGQVSANAPGPDRAPPEAAQRESSVISAAGPGRGQRLDEAARKAFLIPPPPQAGSDGEIEVPGFFSRMLGGLRGMGKRSKSGGPAAQETIEQPRETPQEFATRAALLPPGIEVQTYTDQVTVEQEVPVARETVVRASDLLAKLVNDVRLGGSFEIERVEEIVEGMVESIVRNPDALMWVARLREQDISSYGHGLQVSVYLTAFGRHLGFPKTQLEMLAQVGLLLDIGKIRLPKPLLEKQGRLSDEEFEAVKAHVDHGLAILAETPSIDPDVITGIAQHHERMNGSGYPRGLVGDEISIYGRMAGIVDCFAALTNHRPYAAAVSSYEAQRSITGWGGDYFHEPLVQQFVSSMGVFPVGSLIELSTGEVAIVVAHNRVRRLKPRVLVVTGPDKTRSAHPTMVDLLYAPHVSGEEQVFIKRGLPAGAYGLDLTDFYVA